LSSETTVGGVASATKLYWNPIATRAVPIVEVIIPARPFKFLKDGHALSELGILFTK
jgi:hypothetical protein